MNTTNNTSKLVILGLMTGILLLMAYTPLGYLNIGPLAITFNVIPVCDRGDHTGTGRRRSDRCSFRHDQLLQCIGIGGSSAMGAMLFSINPFLAFCAEIRSTYAGWPSVRIHFPVCTPQNRCVHGKSGNRILFRVFKYSFLYDGFGRSVWQYRIYAGADRWKKYHPVRMRFRRNQCSMRDGIVHNPHRCSRCSALPGKICTGSGEKAGVRQYDFGIGYRKYECGSRLYCGWENPLYRADGDRQWENRA